MNVQNIVFNDNIYIRAETSLSVSSKSFKYSMVRFVNRLFISLDNIKTVAIF